MLKYFTICFSVIILLLFLAACTGKTESPNQNFIPEYTETASESDKVTSDTNAVIDEYEQLESDTLHEATDESSIEDFSEEITDAVESAETDSEETESPHVDTLDENGYCDICGVKIEESATETVKDSEEKEEDSNAEPSSSALFNKFYDNNFDLSATSHSNGSKITEKSDTYTAGDYELRFLNYVNLYKNARDAKGNPALKVGNTTDVGSFEISVPNEISIVIFEIAKYKDHTSCVIINGREYTLTKNSNDGEYERIIVDATTSKSITFATSDEGKICMIRSIEFIK